MDGLPSIFTRFRRSDYGASRRLGGSRVADATVVDGRDAIELRVLRDATKKATNNGAADRLSTFYVDFEKDEDDPSAETRIQCAFSFSGAKANVQPTETRSQPAIRAMSSKRKSNCERCREKRRADASATVKPKIALISIQKQAHQADDEPLIPGTAVNDRRANRESGFFSSEESTSSSLSSSSPIAQIETSTPTSNRPGFQKFSDNQSARSLSFSLRNMLHFSDAGRGAAASMRRRTSTTSSTASTTTTLRRSMAGKARRTSEATIAYEPATSAVPQTAAYARILHERCRSRSVFDGAAPSLSNRVALPFENHLYDRTTVELHAQGNTQAYLLSLLTPPSTRIVVHDPRRDAATFVYGAGET